MSQSFGKTIAKLPGWKDDVLTHKRNFANMVCDGLGGLLLSRLVYWHDDAGPDAKRPGETRLRVEKEGHFWIARANGDWFEETAATGSQVELFFQKWREIGLIEVRRWLFNNKRVNHVRIVEEVFVPLWEFCVANPPSPECFNLRTENGKAAFAKWWSMAESAIATWQKQPRRKAGNSHAAKPESASPITGVTSLVTTLDTTPMGAGADGVDVDFQSFEPSANAGTAAPLLVERLIEIATKNKVALSSKQAQGIVANWPAAMLDDEGLNDALRNHPASYGLDEEITPKGRRDPAREMIERDATHVRLMLSIWHHFPQSTDEWQAKNSHNYTKASCFVTQAMRGGLPSNRWLEIERNIWEKKEGDRMSAENAARAQERHEEYKRIRATLTSNQEKMLRCLIVEEHEKRYIAQKLHSWDDGHARSLESIVLLDPVRRAIILDVTDEEIEVETNPFEEEDEGAGDGVQLDLSMESDAAPPPLRDINADLDIPERGLPVHLARHVTTLWLEIQDGQIVSLAELDAHLQKLPLDGDDKFRIRRSLVEQAPNLPERWEPSSKRRESLERASDDVFQVALIPEGFDVERANAELDLLRLTAREREWVEAAVWGLIEKAQAAA